MGVHGLWRLIEPSGKPVPLETLENKILAVDISIWLHQAIKGFQDSKGASIPNAHLLGIYHRVCKLLYFKIKPVFIFDGGVPALKKQTIAKRNQQKSRNTSEAERLQQQLISTLLKHSAVSKVLSEKTKASLTLPPKKTSKHESMYALPSPVYDSTISSSDDEDMESTTDTPDSSPTKHWDIHTIDMSSVHFKSLPLDVRHEILTELKETRKQNSWGRLHELPKESDDFATYQMKRLLKRQAVQSALDEAEKEMGGHSLSLAELESLLKDHGVATTNDIGRRIASDENTRYIFIKDIKQALEDAKKKELLRLESIQEEGNNENDTDEKKKNKADVEFDEDLEKAIALSLQEEPSTSKTEVSSSTDTDSKNKLHFSFLENFNDGDFESDVSDEMEDVPVKKKFSSAQNYMMEYSGLTPSEISKIFNDKASMLAKTSKGKKIVQKTPRNVVEIMSDSDDNQNVKDKLSESKVTSSEQKDFEDNDKDRSCSKVMDNGDKCCQTDFVQPQPCDSISNVTTAKAESTKTNLDISNDSSSDEFEEVSEEIAEEAVSKFNKDSMEILIDPNQKLEDDLFSDIFNNSDETQKTDITKVIIHPQTGLNDALFCDVLEKKKNEKVKDGVTITTNSEIESDIGKIKGNDISIKEVHEVSSSYQDVYNKTLESNNNGYINNVEKIKKDAPKKTNELIPNSIKSKDQNINVEQMTKLRNDLQKEKIDILVEKSTKERMASNITDQMYQEAQDLLELFGVPYIIAPMEAEAQCAFLDAIELTDGTITDDSDIWLFGGRTVYKNFFNQSKYVMEFRAENIKHHFKLTREQMILLALLVGSDYTIGLKGVGPVTALEILAAFPPSESKEFSLSHTELLSGLKEFRSWFNKGKSAGPGRSALKNKLKNIIFTDNFPSFQVVQAYLDPTVETSRENFSWSKPDFVGLTVFAREKFGWSPKKTEEILKPVIKKLEENQSQKTIKNYFKTVYKADSTDTQNQMSKRVKSAIKQIGKTPEELIAEEMEALSKEKHKRPRSKKNNDKGVDNPKTEQKETQVQSKSRRLKKKTEDISVPSSQTLTNVDENGCELSTNLEEPKKKKPRSRSNNKKESPIEVTESSKQVDNSSDELKKYENIAVELKRRRQIKTELSKTENNFFKKKNKPPKKNLPLEVVPEILEEDEEIKLLQATSSKSLKRAEEIDQEIKNELKLETKRQCVPNIHKKEVIHQKLRDKSDLLRNKMKAIEVFRKSKKGPGYMQKRGKKNILHKEDAELSENSSDD